MTAINELIESDAGLSYRIDCFFIPEAAREEFEAAMRRNVAFLENQIGFDAAAVLARWGARAELGVFQERKTP
jgi:hypothetical protein